MPNPAPSRRSSPAATALVDVTDGDHEWLVELHNDPLVLRNLTHPTPITLEGHLAWWRGLNPSREIRQIFTVDGDRAGFVKFYQIDRANRNCVLGADLHRDFRGRGHARSMWALMLRTCFVEMKLHRVSLTTAAYNTIAQRVYTGLGFREEGRLVQSLWRDGRFHDQICMHLLASDYVPG
jgi:RimJ/RimL family protein N-acetyltransferase